METRVYSTNFKKSIAETAMMAGLLVLLTYLTIDIFSSDGFRFSTINMVVLGVIFLAAVIVISLLTFKEIRTTVDDITIANIITKKTIRIPKKDIIQIAIRYTRTEDTAARLPMSPYVSFLFKDSGKNNTTRNVAINLHGIKHQREFLKEIAEIPCEHTYNGEKANLKIIAEGMEESGRFY